MLISFINLKRHVIRRVYLFTLFFLCEKVKRVFGFMTSFEFLKGFFVFMILTGVLKT